MPGTANRAIVVALTLVLCADPPALAARTPRPFDKGKKAYLEKDYHAAEERFRAVTERAPDFLMGHLYLAQTLFSQQKYKEAVPEYQKARDIAARTGELDRTNERILKDRLGLSLGSTGQWNQAKEVFEEAIERDPDHPLYHYHLARVFAETGDIDQALVFLRSAYQRKANLPEGETLPDPRADSLFKRYSGDVAFGQALKEMGL